MTNFLYLKYYVLADNNFSPLSKNNLAKAIDLFKLLGHICFFLTKYLTLKWLKSRVSEAAGGDDLDQSVFVAASLQPQILPWCQSPTFGSVFLEAEGFPCQKRSLITLMWPKLSPQKDLIVFTPISRDRLVWPINIVYKVLFHLIVGLLVLVSAPLDWLSRVCPSKWSKWLNQWLLVGQLE